MNQNQIIGSNIRQFREKFGLTQEELATYLGVTREEVSYYETGKRNIPTEVISKAAKLYGLDEYDLFEVDAEMKCAKLAFAFKADSLKPEDLNHMANFKNIVINYLHMKKAACDESSGIREKSK